MLIPSLFAAAGIGGNVQRMIGDIASLQKNGSWWRHKSYRGAGKGVAHEKRQATKRRNALRAKAAKKGGAK